MITIVLQKVGLVNNMKKPFNHPSWSKNAVIYELNLRQFSMEGTIKAAAKQLPRLKELGVDIIWLMPINPIGKKNRKGSLGSYYSISNYKKVNPEFGTKGDLKSFVNFAHKLGLKVIVDWVPNHTAWDHHWVKEHPEYYLKNDKGQIHAYTMKGEHGVETWEDVVGLDYSNKKLWKDMTEAMEYWIKEVKLDGYRCDVAGLLPLAFWNQLRHRLDKIKKVFMLAEWSAPNLHEKAFDMTYDWPFNFLMQDIAQGKKDVLEIKKYLASRYKEYPVDAYRMQFVSNHDRNSWNYDDLSMFGEGLKAHFLLTYVMDGMPLIYNGQESLLDKKIAFFEKDPINWRKYEYSPYLKALNSLRHKEKALWSGQFGAKIKILPATTKSVLVASKVNGNSKINVWINFSDKNQKVVINRKETTLKPFEYVVHVNNKEVKL
jgi:glycosidase